MTARASDLVIYSDVMRIISLRIVIRYYCCYCLVLILCSKTHNDDDDDDYRAMTLNITELLLLIGPSMNFSIWVKKLIFKRYVLLKRGRYKTYKA